MCTEVIVNKNLASGSPCHSNLIEKMNDQRKKGSSGLQQLACIDGQVCY